MCQHIVYLDIILLIFNHPYLNLEQGRHFEFPNVYFTAITSNVGQSTKELLNYIKVVYKSSKPMALLILPSG